jgi:hypothetical protein
MTKQDKNYNSADETQVAAAKRDQHNDNQTEIKDLRATMSTASGRRTIWNLLSKCGVFQGGFNPDSNAVYFNNGKRDIGLYYIEQLTEHCHEEYLQMHKEQILLKLKRG